MDTGVGAGVRVKLNVYADGYSISINDVESDVADFGDLLEYPAADGNMYVALVDIDDNTDTMYSLLGEWVWVMKEKIPESAVEIVDVVDAPTAPAIPAAAVPIIPTPITIEVSEVQQDQQDQKQDQDQNIQEKKEHE